MEQSLIPIDKSSLYLDVELIIRVTQFSILGMFKIKSLFSN